MINKYILYINLEMNNYSELIIPFGKYRNTTFKDIYNKDQQYLKWLNTQPWFKIKFTYS